MLDKKRCIRCGQFTNVRCTDPGCLIEPQDDESSPLDEQAQLETEEAKARDKLFSVMDLKSSDLLQQIRPEFNNNVTVLALLDARALINRHEFGGDNWARHGGVGAFMRLAQEWDNLELLVSNTNNNDIFKSLISQTDRGESRLIDTIRTLRRQFFLIEEKILWHLPADKKLPVSNDNQD